LVRLSNLDFKTECIKVMSNTQMFISHMQ
jgi:hypothetical protein